MNSIRQELLELLPNLWRFCLSLTGQRTSAEDLLQNCCVRIIEKQQQFTPGTRFDHWAFRIARNQWLNEVRSQKYRNGVEQTVDVEQHLVSSETSPAMTLYYTEVINAVIALPEAQRSTVILVYVEGFSYADAAKILDIPIGTVMSRLSAARKRLASLNQTSQSGTGETHFVTSGNSNFDKEQKVRTGESS